MSDSRTFPGQACSVNLCKASWLISGTGHLNARQSVGGAVSAQCRDIFRALPQGRQFDGNNRKTVIKVFAETAIGNGLTQILGGRGDHPDIHWRRLALADTTDLMFLQDTQQLGLQFQREVADFIDSDPRRHRQHEQAAAGAVGTGEGAFGVSDN